MAEAMQKTWLEQHTSLRTRYYIRGKPTNYRPMMPPGLMLEMAFRYFLNCSYSTLEITNYVLTHHS